MSREGHQNLFMCFAFIGFFSVPRGVCKGFFAILDEEYDDVAEENLNPMHHRIAPLETAVDTAVATSNDVSTLEARPSLSAIIFLYRFLGLRKDWKHLSPNFGVGNARKTHGRNVKLGLDLDGRNRARVIAESLARVIAAIRITSVRWRSYLPLKTQNWSS